MNRAKIKRIFSYIFTSLFLVLLGSAVLVTLFQNKPRYSYFENRNLSVTPKISVEGILDGTFFTDVDTIFKDYAAGRNALLKLDTYINMNILHRPVVNGVVVQDEVLLPYNAQETVNLENIEQRAKVIAANLKRNAQITESYGGEFCYVAVPCQYVCYEEAYPAYLNNRAEYTKASSSALFAELEKQNVEYIDMFARYKQLGSPAAYTSTVDNHFGISGGYMTYRAIMEHFEQKGYKGEILKEGEYEQLELPNTYLGSRNRKLFGLYDTTEKLSVIYPKKNISFTRYDNGNLVEPTVYQLPEETDEDVLYGLYMGGDIASTCIQTDRPEFDSILIYGDSFTNAVECVMWYSFDTMYSLDMRHYKEMNIVEFIEKYQPEYVVCIRDYESFLDTSNNGQ